MVLRGTRVQPLCLLDAVRANSLDQVRQVCEADSADGAREELRRTDWSGCTALLIACELGFQDIAHLLLDYGADFRVKDKESNTCLHFSVYGNCPSVCARLLRLGASPDERNIYGSTPLHWAAYWDRPETVALLRAAGAQLLTDSAAQGPVQYARSDTVRLYLTDRDAARTAAATVLAALSAVSAPSSGSTSPPHTPPGRAWAGPDDAAEAAAPTLAGPCDTQRSHSSPRSAALADSVAGLFMVGRGVQVAASAAQ